MKLTLLALSAVIAFASCKANKTVATNSTLTVIDLDQPKYPEVVKIRVSDTLHLSLEGNVTTGYNWYSNIDSTNQTFAIIGETYAAKNNNPNIVGAPSIKTFAYIAKKVGKETVLLEYYQGWNKNVDPKTGTRKIVVEVVEK